ncbi:hypothetical protein HA052_22210 [Chromobacterium haemolyticum]|uniref:Nucleotidyltransferase domain-containing protein n=1 Tax=Chromobacterium fluminis TaxID=3044269 RepID=A0ABX0LE56_9NEIS|nr:hypothetical protein [Chromobacterium haemolyticum]NHR07911.1 hypothetical protein [Chromobacterium haemolyticum]
MMISSLLAEILNTLAGLQEKLPNTKWYGFGSFFHGQSSFNDIDLLAVCRDASEVLSVRSALYELSSVWPIHLIIMTDSEEAETDFIFRQGCQLLVPAAV